VLPTLAALFLVFRVKEIIKEIMFQERKEFQLRIKNLERQHVTLHEQFEEHKRKYHDYIALQTRTTSTPIYTTQIEYYFDFA